MRPLRPPSLEAVARELGRAPSPRCACCGADGAAPGAELFGAPLCAGCRQAWMGSGERARANSAAADFIERRHREIGAAR